MKNLKRLLIVLSVGIGIAGYFFYAELTTTSITVYHTNDVHGHIETSAVLSNFLKLQKKPFVLLDAGDIFQGTPEGDLTNGEVVVKIMNELGYDAMVVGNHELDKGQKQLKKLIEMANFSVLGANVVDKRTRQKVIWLEPYYIKEIYGVKIGVLGLTTSAMPYLTMPEVRRGLEFQREVDAAKKYIPELKQKADLIIALTHTGLSKDSEDDVFLAENTDGLDIIIGAHTHSFLEKPINVKNSMIVQAGCYGKCVGKLDLKIRNKKIVSKKYELISLNKKKFGEDEELKKIIEKLTSAISAKMDSIVGSSSQNLSRSATDGSGEIPLGNWQTDVFRKITNSDIAFQNAGGIRADLPEGKLTMRHIYELAPFGNTIFTMKLTGGQLKEILEKSVSGKFGMLQVSGLKFKYDKSRKEGDRVVEIAVGNKPLNLKKYYKIATNSFVAKGGDDFNIFKQGKEIRDTGIIDRDAQLLFVKKYSPLKAQLEGRMVNITKE
ncbi:MAG: bifunctional metallophosphatase/5'-nucleotidase [Elusimicrobia bacterium]|nr:bifunctional metallophosphatase/5'-nucleotidase [Elusimicrobiota bacterium]